jgi:hypothetical protein
MISDDFGRRRAPLSNRLVGGCLVGCGRSFGGGIRGGLSARTTDGTAEELRLIVALAEAVATAIAARGAAFGRGGLWFRCGLRRGRLAVDFGHRGHRRTLAGFTRLPRLAELARFTLLAGFPELPLFAGFAEFTRLTLLARLPMFAWFAMFARLMIAVVAVAEVTAFARVLTIAFAALTLAATLVVVPLVTRRALDRVALLVETSVGLLLAARIEHAGLGFHPAHGRLEVAAEFVALVVAEVVTSLALLAERTTLHGIGVAAHLLQLLLAIGHDDAGVMFRMLKVVLGEDGVAGGLRIARERQVFLGDMGGRAPDFHIRSVRFEAARQRILTFAVVIVTTAAPTILLSLPHAIPVLDPR